MKTCNRDGETFRLITWRQLRSDYELETVAEGRALRGRVIFKDEKFWDAGVSKIFCVQDLESEEDEPAEWQVSLVLPKGKDSSVENQRTLLTNEEDEIQIGAEVAFYDPRSHYFVDGEEGLVIDHPAGMRIIQKAKDVILAPLTKIKIAQSLKKKGNTWMRKSESHRAVGNYNAALLLLEKTVLTLSELSDAQKSDDNVSSDADYVIAARTLQSECASNLMLIGVKQMEWRAVIEIGQEVLKYGASNDVQCKVLYRMGLAFEKMGQLEMALDYATRAKQVFRGKRDESIEGLYQRTSLATTGPSEMRGFEEHSRTTSLPGMHRKFGYRALFFADPSTVKHAEEFVLDLSSHIMAKGCVHRFSSGMGEKKTEEDVAAINVSSEDNANSTTQRLKSRLLYLCLNGPPSMIEKKYMNSVLRVKTLIYFHFSPLPLARANAAPSIPFFSSFFIGKMFSWFLGRSNRCDSPLHQDEEDSFLGVAEKCIPAPSEASGSFTLLPLPAGERVVVSVNVAPFLFPSVLLQMCRILLFFGWYSVVCWLQIMYFRWCMWWGTWTFQSRLLESLAAERDGRKTQKGLTAITAHILSNPENYPIAFCGENITADSREKNHKAAIKKEEMLKRLEQEDVVLPILNGYMSLLFQEKKSVEDGIGTAVDDYMDTWYELASIERKKDNCISDSKQNAEVFKDVRKASKFLFDHSTN